MAEDVEFERLYARDKRGGVMRAARAQNLWNGHF
jgi:hypothetical protein